MPLQDKIIDIMLVKSKIVDEPALEKLHKEAAAKKIPLYKYLISKKVVSEEVLYENLSDHLNIPYINLTNQTIRRDILFLIPEPIAHTHSIVAWDKSKNTLKVATSEPGDIQIIEFISKKTGFNIESHLASPASIQNILKQYHKTLQAEFENITKDKMTGLPGLDKEELIN